MIDRQAFQARKKAFLERLLREAGQGRVDEDIYPFLLRINELPWLYTTSSCSGRIMLADVKTPSYSKGRGFRPIAKWHHAVSARHIAEAIEGREDVWMLVRGAILHVAVDSARRAMELVALAHATGHKHSGIIAVNRAGVIVEILGEERLDIPLKQGGEVVADLDAATAMANRVLLLAKARLAWLIAKLEAKYLGGEAPNDEELRKALRGLAQCLYGGARR